MKKSLFKKAALLLAFVMAAGTLAACGNSSPNGTQSGSNSGERKLKDHMTIVVPYEPRTLDPTESNHENIGIITRFICESLFDVTPEGEYVNWLLEDWELEGDTTLKLKLKEGIKFSTGEEITAEDVLWHYTRIPTKAVSKSQYDFIDTEKSKVIDAHNLVIEFQRPWSPFVDLYANHRGDLTSKKAFEAMGEEAFARAPVGTGAYKVDEWVSGSHITLSANEYYHGGEVPLKKITIKFIEEPTARVIELETGAADIAYFIEPADVSRVESIPGYHIEMGDSVLYYVLCLSMKEPHFQDVRVRQALHMAIDQQSLVEACSDGVGTPIYSFGPPRVKEGMKEFPPYPYDVEKAKRLLAEAGYPDGFTIDLHIEPQGPVFKRLAETIQSMWGEIGVNAKIETSTLATYDAQKGGLWQASIRSGTAAQISNVWTIYESSFGSRLNGNDGWLDGKLLDLRKYYTGDPMREQTLEEVADYLNEKRYTYPLMTMPNIYAVSDNVEGFEYHFLNYYLNTWKWKLYE